MYSWPNLFIIYSDSSSGSRSLRISNSIILKFPFIIISLWVLEVKLPQKDSNKWIAVSVNLDWRTKKPKARSFRKAPWGLNKLLTPLKSKWRILKGSCDNSKMKEKEHDVEVKNKLNWMNRENNSKRNWLISTTNIKNTANSLEQGGFRTFQTKNKNYRLNLNRIIICQLLKKEWNLSILIIQGRFKKNSRKYKKLAEQGKKNWGIFFRVISTERIKTHRKVQSKKYKSFYQENRRGNREGSEISQRTFKNCRIRAQPGYWFSQEKPSTWTGSLAVSNKTDGWPRLASSKLFASCSSHLLGSTRPCWAWPGPLPIWWLGLPVIIWEISFIRRY